MTSVEAAGSTGHAPNPFDGNGSREGLAIRDAVEVEDGVAADDEGVVMADEMRGDVECLRSGELECKVCRPDRLELGGHGLLIDLAHLHDRGDAGLEKDPPARG